MKQNGSANGVLAILVAAATAAVLASAPQSGGALPVIAASGGPAAAEAGQGHATGAAPAVQVSAPAVVPTWQQVNINGFADVGAPGAVEVSAGEAFGGYLYAATYNPIDLPPSTLDGTQIFRSADGMTWKKVTEPAFGNNHDTAPPAILDFAPFNGYLYAGAGRGNASQLWRSANGTIWAPIDVTGFSDPNNVAITALTEFGGKFYAGVSNQVNGAQIWSSFTGDNNTWSRVGPIQLGTVPAAVTDFAQFGDALYAAITYESDLTAQVWRSTGGNWETVVSNGFGSANTMSTGGMAVFSGYLYVGAGNTSSGAQLWRSNDGTTWNQVITPAFGDANNQKIDSVYVFQNQLYVSTKNASTGIEIWRWTNSTQWEQVNQDGFGDSSNDGFEQRQRHRGIPGPSLRGHVKCAG